MKKKNRYYVYALLDPRKPGTFRYGDLEFDYEPFYIGKGSGNRIERHYYRCNKEDRTRKNNKIIKLKREGLKYKYVILKKNLLEKNAFKIEIETIKTVGRLDYKKGPLTNGDDGGEGVTGRIITKEFRKKISIALKGRFVGRDLNLEWKKKISLNSAKYWQGKNIPKDAVEKTASKNRNKESKKTIHYILVDPSGKEIHIKNGLEKFCKENNLQRSHLVSVASGKRKHHKGWVCLYGKIEEKHPNNLFNLEYKLIDPNGKIFFTKNIKQFSKNNSLDRKRLYECAKDKRAFHKGWKCSFVN